MLRFPEFRNSGVWKKFAIGDISDVVAGATPSTSNLNYWGGDVRWMSSGELNLKRVYDVEKRITELGLKDNSTKLIPPGSILIGLAGQGKTRGTAAINYVELCTNQSIASILPNDTVFVSEFLYQKVDSLYQYLRFLSKGDGGRGGLNLQIIKSIELALPSIEEQHKIADCLYYLDELIASHTKKHEELRALKKGLMQQLFPAGDKTIPEFRFPEFVSNGEWTEMSLGEVFVEQSRPIKMQDDHDYSLVTVKRRYGGVVSRGVLKGEAIKVKSQFSVKKDDFLISKRQIVHCACGLVPESLEGSIVSNEYSVLVAKNGYDVEFLNYFSQQFIVSQSFLKCSIGIVIEKMLFKLDDWLKERFLFPNLKEQQKIADCLSSIDELIIEQTQKIEDLKAHKKGLVQQLFPAVNEVGT